MKKIERVWTGVFSWGKKQRSGPHEADDEAAVRVLVEGASDSMKQLASGAGASAVKRADGCKQEGSGGGCWNVRAKEQLGEGAFDLMELRVDDAGNGSGEVASAFAV
eukprot:jgi/Psemu1/47477/gm1.47477_g